MQESKTPIRQRIYEIIEKSSGNDKISTAYDYFMIVVIVVSLIPLAFKDESKKGIDEKEDDTSE